VVDSPRSPQGELKVGALALVSGRAAPYSASQPASSWGTNPAGVITPPMMKLQLRFAPAIQPIQSKAIFF
jgi:hypothetical protein